MAITRVKNVSFPCRQCDNRLLITTCFLLDVHESPDIVRYILSGGLERVRCSLCGTVTTLPEEYLLAYFRDDPESPIVLFSPSGATPEEIESSEIVFFLVGELGKRLTQAERKQIIEGMGARFTFTVVPRSNMKEALVNPVFRRKTSDDQ